MPYLFVNKAVVTKHIPCTNYGKVHPCIGFREIALEGLHSSVRYWATLARPITDVKANMVELDN